MSCIDQMQNAQGAYVDFDDNQKAPDHQHYQNKVSTFDSMNGNPELLIMLFLTAIALGGTQQEGPFAGDGSSYTRDLENSLSEVGKELNYASSYRNTISEIKDQLQDGQTSGGSTDLVTKDIDAVEQYRTTGFTKDAPQIFQDSDDTFTKAEAQIESVIASVNKDYGGSFQTLWTAAKQAGDQEAGGLIQTFTNAVDSLQSAVGVQNNVLTTQMQDTESTYKSFTAWVAQMIKSLFSIIDAAIQKAGMSS